LEERSKSLTLLGCQLEPHIIFVFLRLPPTQKHLEFIGEQFHLAFEVDFALIEFFFTYLIKNNFAVELI